MPNPFDKPANIDIAIKELTWWPIAFFAVIGAPALLLILESIFVHHDLVSAMQWILDGYDRFLRVLGAMLEPAFLPALNWMARQLGCTIDLDPVWRPLFMLYMIPFVSSTRANLAEKRFRFAAETLFFGFAISFATALFGGLSLGANSFLGSRGIVLGLVLTTLAIGISRILAGLRQGSKYHLTIGCHIVGGFVVAGLICLADYAARHPFVEPLVTC